MYKTTIHLRQHTPIIHFQHDQSGATLRATELKPKLDAYLIENAFNNSFEQYKTYLIGYDAAQERKVLQRGKSYEDSFKHKAFDYKMRIESDKTWTHHIRFHKFDTNGVLKKNSVAFPCYFADVGDEKGKKKFVYTPNEVRVCVMSKKTKLINLIKKYFGSLINKSNFGSRQSKGFGSFSKLNIKDNGKRVMTFVRSNFYFDYSPSVKEDEEIKKYKRLYPNLGTSDEVIIEMALLREIFRRIELFHKAIRSGYNVNNRYMKSTLFKYFKEKNIHWDKRSIKQKYFTETLRDQQEEYDHPDVLQGLESKSDRGNNFLVRDLLGLSTSSEWKIPYRATITKEHLDNEIDRFKSPITYKPIYRKRVGSFRIYIYFSNISQSFMDQSFTIKNGRESKLTLDTPKEFSLNDYFQFLCDEDRCNLDELFNHEKNEDTEIIKNLFSDLRKNYNKEILK